MLKQIRIEVTKMARLNHTDQGSRLFLKKAWIKGLRRMRRSASRSLTSLLDLTAIPRDRVVGV